MRNFLVVLVLFFSAEAYAVKDYSYLSQELSEAEVAFQAEQNKRASERDFLNSFLPLPSFAQSSLERLPFAEYTETGYLLFSDPLDLEQGVPWYAEALNAKKTMAQNLPEDVTLVIFTGTSGVARELQIRQMFSDDIEQSRLKVIYLPSGGDGFWARDGLPVPTFSTTKGFTVVDARYYYPFEDDLFVSKHFNAAIVEHEYYFEGGNFINNSKGDCLVIDNERVLNMGDTVFSQYYGCQRLFRFEHKHGIGHADEVFKFLSDDVVVTSDAEYAQILRKNGFTVEMLPEPYNQGVAETQEDFLFISPSVVITNNDIRRQILSQQGYYVIFRPKPWPNYATHVNALTIGDRIFFPAYDEETDEIAKKLYESYGYKAIPVFSNLLSNVGAGSVHCITMTYPKVPLTEVIDHFKILLERQL